MVVGRAFLFLLLHSPVAALGLLQLFVLIAKNVCVCACDAAVCKRLRAEVEA